MKTNRIARAMLMALVAIAVFYKGVISGSEKEIIVVSTNDVHASIDRLPKLITLVDQLREDNENVIVLDAGDRWTGNPYVDKAELRGKPLVDLMNEVNYDYLALGNHEFDYQQDGLKACIDIFEAPVLCANADFGTTGLDEYITPYDIFEIDGIRVAVISFIQIDDNGIPSAMPAYMEGITFVDGVDKSQEYRFLRDSAALVIGLTHLGYSEDSVLVSNNDMFDLIVGGHSHTMVPVGRNINGAVVTQAGGRLDGVGITRIKLKSGKVHSISNEVISIDDLEPDAAALEYVESCKANSPLNETIGKIDIQLDEIGLINMFSDVLCKMSGAEVALQNTGSIRIDSLGYADVTSANIYQLEPFNNYVVTQEMTIEQIKDMIMNTFRGGYARGIDLNPSGMKYEVVVDQDNKVIDIKLYDLKGRAMKNRTYKLATSNYVSSAYRYEAKNKVTGELIAPAICDSFKQVSVYKGDNTPRATITKVK